MHHKDCTFSIRVKGQGLHNHIIIDMSSRTLRYKRKPTDRQQTDTEADLERKNTEVDVGQLPSDEELLDVKQTS